MKGRARRKRERRTGKESLRQEAALVLREIDSVKSFVASFVESSEEICEYIRMELKKC